MKNLSYNFYKVFIKNTNTEDVYLYVEDNKYSLYINDEVPFNLDLEKTFFKKAGASAKKNKGMNYYIKDIKAVIDKQGFYLVYIKKEKQ
jgi:uncharacterized protein YcgL (UPF0745 family)